MTEERKSDSGLSGGKVAIIVATITVVGTLGSALLANWDKLRGSSQRATTHTARPPTTRPATEPVRNPAPTDDRLEDALRDSKWEVARDETWKLIVARGDKNGDGFLN